MSETLAVEALLKRDRIIVVVAIFVMFLIAVAYTVSGVGMSMSALEMTRMAYQDAMRSDDQAMGQGMGEMMMPATWTLTYGVLVFLMWWVMMIAMMIPSAAPTVLLHAALVRRMQVSAQVPSQSVAFVGGYLVIWGIFSVIATVLQWMLELNHLVSPNMMVLTSTLLGSFVLLAAGVYQLSPIKDMCLDHCRNPVQFLVEKRRSGLSGAFRMGVEHGMFCLGCCWFLMALLFFGGIMNLYWIAGLAIFVALEKLAPGGKILSVLSGTALICAGLLVMVDVLI